MHLDVGNGPLPDSPSDLADQPDADCVAACYRCLMSYYNQPDHESLDRRDENARAVLLRLAGARTAPQTGTDNTLGAELYRRPYHHERPRQLPKRVARIGDRGPVAR